MALGRALIGPIVWEINSAHLLPTDRGKGLIIVSRYNQFKVSLEKYYQNPLHLLNVSSKLSSFMFTQMLAASDM